MNYDVIVIGIFIAVLLVFGSIFLFLNLLGSPQKRIRDRLDRFKDRFSPNAANRVQARARGILAKDKGTPLEQMLRDILPRPAELRARLNKTGKQISLSNYAMASVAVAIAVFALFTIVGGVNFLLALIMAVVFGIGGPHFMVGRWTSKRLEAFTGLFPEAIDLQVRGLRSGLPINESIKIVGREVDDPVGIEFRKIADAIRLGKTLEDALWASAEILDTPDFKFFVISLAVQKETGGNLAETLENLSVILRKRHQMKLKVRALSAEGKASAYIVGSLPFVMFGITLSMNYDYASILFTDPRGIMAMGIGLVWMSLGVLIMAKMISFEI
jgi:tight adherence protein B